ncbi:hypothetical protein D3C85_1815710 [compost metagenome]
MRVKGPGVHDLLAMGIDQREGLPLFKPDRDTAPGRQADPFTGLNRRHCIHALFSSLSGAECLQPRKTQGKSANQ